METIYEKSWNFVLSFLFFVSKRSASFFQDNKYTSFSFSFQIQLKVFQISDKYFRNMQAVRSEYSREIERESDSSTLNATRLA